MRAIIETSFDVVYLISVITIGILMILKNKGTLKHFRRNRKYLSGSGYIKVIQHSVNLVNRCGPVASLEGPGRWIGEVYPTSHFLTIARGTFSKALDLTDLWQLFIPLLIAIPLVMGLSILLLKKQEG